MANARKDQTLQASELLSRADANRTSDIKRPYRHSRTVRIVAIACAVLMLLCGTVTAAGGAYVGFMLGMINYDDGTQNYDDLPLLPGDIDDGSVDTVIENPEQVNIDHVELRGNTADITNVMLIGVDGREAEGYSARSDTNMILSVNTSAKTIKLASILRDTWVTLAGRDRDGDGEDDYDKLNAAFYYGGFNMLSDTIEQNFKLSVNQYIAVDFAAFEKAVDALGGVDLELTAEEAGFIPKESDDPDRFATPDNPDLEPLGSEAGTYHLNGQQALAYCRIRTLYSDSDFSRQSNQRKVIDQLMQKAKTMNFATLTNVLMAVLPYVQTNMSQQELLTYAAQALQYTSYTIDSDFSIPHGGDYKDGWIGDGLGLWLLDQEKSTLELHQYLYGDAQ